jgi:hypothetical protein
MNKIKCAIRDCQSIFETVEKISKKGTFVCKLHDHVGQDVFFQDCQFDKDLRGGTRLQKHATPKVGLNDY